MFGEAPAPRPGTCTRAAHLSRAAVPPPPTPGRESFRGSLAWGVGAPDPSNPAGGLRGRDARRSGFGRKGRGGSRTRQLPPPQPALHSCPAAAPAAAPSPLGVLSPERPSGPGVREASHINLR